MCRMRQYIGNISAKAQLRLVMEGSGIVYINLRKLWIQEKFRITFEGDKGNDKKQFASLDVRNLLNN